MSKQLTIRSVSATLAARLKALAQERGESVNATVLRVLEDATGVDGRKARLERYATWTVKDAAVFDKALADHRRVDPRDWE